jgi:hypothetical protein
MARIVLNAYAGNERSMFLDRSTAHTRCNHSRAFVSAIASEPELSRLVGKVVGAGSNLVLLTPEKIATTVLPVDTSYDKPNDMRLGDPNVIEQVLRRLHAVVQEDTFDVVFVTPIWALELQTPLELEPGLVLDQISDDETLMALQMTVIVAGGDLGSRKRYKREPYRRIVLRRTVALPKTILDRMPTPDELVDVVSKSEEPHGFDDPERLLDLLPLVSSGHAWTGATMSWAVAGPPWSIRSASCIGTAVPGLGEQRTPRPSITLDDAAAMALSRYWNSLATHEPERGVALALRRLRAAAERRNETDRILDLVIAAEAVYLSDDDSHDELRFRTSLRAAFYLESNRVARRIVYKVMCTAYDVRSDVAHGREPRTVKFAGTEISMNDLADRVELILRRTLQKRLDEGIEPDWASLIVGPPT